MRDTAKVVVVGVAMLVESGCGGVEPRELQADEVAYENELMDVADVWAALDRLVDDGNMAKDRLGGHDEDLANARTGREEAATDRAAIHDELARLRDEIETLRTRTVARVSGYGNDNLDEGKLESRVLHFTKKHPSTGLRVSYVDVFRVVGNGEGCSWEIRFDDVSCTPEPIRFDKYTAASGVTDDHDPTSVFGTCFGIPAGPVTIDVWVTRGHGHQHGDCYTGWNNSSWALEVEEVW